MVFTFLIASLQHVSSLNHTQWGATVAKIMIPSAENPELLKFLLKSLNRSEYSFAYFTYCQEFFSFFQTSACIVQSALLPDPPPLQPSTSLSIDIK